MFPALTQQREFAATLERTLVSGTRMDAIEKGRQFGPARVQARTRRGGLDRKAHLDVCRAELIAGKPPMLGQLGLQISQMQCKNGIGEVSMRSKISFISSGGMAEPSA